MIRPTLALALVLFTAAARAQDAGPALTGQVQGRTYISPTGAFKVTIPVLPELGGSVTDTPNVVTFQDEFNTHVSIAAFPQDATQRWELNTRGLKEYLIYFFSNYVLSDFKQAFEGTQIESAKFVPGQFDGSLLTSILLPGGSMFADKAPRYFGGGAPPVAKRGNLLFVKNGHIFVLSVELAEKVIEGTAFKKTVAEEDEILRQRLTDIAGKIQFAKPPAAPTPAPAPAAAAVPPPGIAAPKK
jgi:hypothetical protein